jgi:preprotein translocase subunit SecF
MELFKPKNLNINFVQHFKKFSILSAILTAVGLIAIVVPGFNYGIDFRGGVEAQVKFAKPVEIGDLRASLDGKLPNLSIIAFDEGGKKGEYIITSQADSKDKVTEILKGTLTEKYGAEGQDTWTVSKLDVVGAKVGANLRKSAILSLIYTCLLIGLYIYWRFDIRFAPGALLGIIHDLVVVSLIIVLLRIEFSTTMVAALLTLAGYSINDTVVIYDRIREIEAQYLGKTKNEIVNIALNSTLSRTLMTSIATLASCLILFFVGGNEIADFALVLFLGIIFGTYSSLFVSTPLYLWADRKFGAQAKSFPQTA